MNTFCTIISPDYYSFALNLYHSLKKYNDKFKLQILITNDDIPEKIKSQLPENIKIHYVKNLAESKLLSLIISKYQYATDSFRWSLKPVFIEYLLIKFDKVIYLDCDLYFYSDPAFLFKELDDTSILLSPHWGESDSLISEDNFLLNFRIGLYNAGFIGATARGESSLQWWASACSYNIQNHEIKGLYDDQRYLDIIPILDEESKILRNRGCNIGSWNITSNKRHKTGDCVLINNQYPIVFIHFNNETINQILNGNDPLLLPYLKEYEHSFQNHGQQLMEFVKPLADWKKTNFFLKLKRKTKLRTRIKKWLFRLSTK